MLGHLLGASFFIQLLLPFQGKFHCHFINKVTESLNMLPTSMQVVSFLNSFLRCAVKAGYMLLWENPTSWFDPSSS